MILENEFFEVAAAEDGTLTVRDKRTGRTLAGLNRFVADRAQVLDEIMARAAREHGMEALEIEVSGPGSGRESALRALQSVGFNITSIKGRQPPPRVVTSGVAWAASMNFSQVSGKSL